jgi:hypothetical protein
MTDEFLSEWPTVQNGLFLLFLLCFFLNMRMLGSKARLPAFMIQSLFRQQDQQGPAAEMVDNEFFGKLILCLQAIVMSALLVYSGFSYTGSLPFETIGHFFGLLGITILILLLFLVYKFLTGWYVGFLFFSKDEVQLWTNQFFSIIAFCGMLLLIPTLLIFYLQDSYRICFWFGILYVLSVEILICYKIFIIFFQQKGALLYFILYLCAQELIPLFCTYKALEYLYKI